MNINFMSSKDRDEKQLMHSKSDNIETLIGNETLPIIKEFFQSILSRYQIGLETSMKDSDWVFESIDGLHYKCHRISFNRSGLYIEFTAEPKDWKPKDQLLLVFFLLLKMVKKK